MNSVAVLNQINPGGADRFNPFEQASDWLDSIPAWQARPRENHYANSLSEDLAKIALVAQEKNLSLVIRDWSYLDFIGFPFNPAPTCKFQLAESLRSQFQLVQVALVRNPIDQYLQMKKISALSQDWSASAVWRGMREFGEQVQEMNWIRYEDFVEAPDESLRHICHISGIPFDPDYKRRWFKELPGFPDVPVKAEREIRRQARTESIDAILPDITGNRDVAETLRILGYPMPEALQRPDPCQLVSADMVSEVPHWRNAAMTDVNSRNWDAAAVAHRRILIVEPRDRDALLGLSRCLIEIGLLQEANEVLLRSLAWYPECADSLQLLSQCLTRQGRRFAAIPHLRKLIQKLPDNTELLFQLSNLLTGVGAVDEALQCSRRLLKLQPTNHANSANYLLYTNYSDSLRSDEIATEHIRLGNRFASQTEKVFAPRSRQKIRLGYLSADFRCHPVGKIINGLLATHDNTRFEIFAYRDHATADGITAQIRASSDTMRDTFDNSTEELLEIIRNDELDVLFDLGGFTNGGNRLDLFARRAAPVQISFLGYPNTTALQTMDYRITDHFADPPGSADQLYSERLIRMESGMLAWNPYPECSEMADYSRSGRPVIGSFNSVAKLSVGMIKCVAEIMCRCSDATLVFKYGDRFEVPDVQDRILRLFCERGVLPSRIRFLPCALSLRQHLEVIHTVDLAVDAFPYQGTMTSLETLSVGTPLVSLAGDYYAHRATSAMLYRMGVPELVAKDAEEYVDICCHLIQDLDGLRALRSVVHEKFWESSLTRTREFMAELENCIAGIIGGEFRNSGLS